MSEIFETQKQFVQFCGRRLMFGFSAFGSLLPSGRRFVRHSRSGLRSPLKCARPIQFPLNDAMTQMGRKTIRVIFLDPAEASVVPRRVRYYRA